MRFRSCWGCRKSLGILVSERGQPISIQNGIHVLMYFLHYGAQGIKECASKSVCASMNICAFHFTKGQREVTKASMLEL